MFINIPKTLCMLLGSRYNLNHNEPLAIFIIGEIIQTVDHNKLLGIITDKYLSWDKQIDGVCLNVCCLS